MWTTMPQFIYYRLKAWNMVSTPPRASNLSQRRYLTQLYTTLLQDHIDPQCSTPLERKGCSKTDSTQYCNSKKHQNREEAQFLAAPPMYQIQPNGSIKDYLRHMDAYMEHKLKTSKRSIQKDEARRNTEVKENHTTVKVLHCTLHLWTLYLKFKLNHGSPKILNWECT